VRILIVFIEFFRESIVCAESWLDTIHANSNAQEGVAVYAKPARSSWRLAASLSGGQQATIGLALIFGFQFVYKSPFYLLDEVKP